MHNYSFDPLPEELLVENERFRVMAKGHSQTNLIKSG